MAAPSAPVRVEPVHGERALRIDAPDGVRLLVGDLHVGLEGELARDGIRLASQTRRMTDRLLALVHATGAQAIYMLGDVKNSIGHTSRDEARELADLVRALPVEVHIVPGNHDADLRLDAANVTMHAPTGVIIAGEVGAAHGHAWPAPEVLACPVLVTCHNHPSVLLVDELGHRHKEPAWIRARAAPCEAGRRRGVRGDARFVFVPAFNDLLGGVAFNEPGGRVLGPLLTSGVVDLDDAEVHTLDGVLLGRLRDLRRFAGRGR